jgi:hypothetical protein
MYGCSVAKRTNSEPVTVLVVVQRVFRNNTADGAISAPQHRDGFRSFASTLLGRSFTRFDGSPAVEFVLKTASV